MARQPRLIIPGVAVHVVQRRVDRSACFREDSDKFVYLSALRDLLEKTHCSLHAYCLMTTHVHLLLTPATEAGCGELMRDLGRIYVRYFNDRYARSGTLWEGRFHSCLVESPDYVLNCYRYIERNPVRAAIVGEASAYSWSTVMRCSIAHMSGIRGRDRAAYGYQRVPVQSRCVLRSSAKRGH